MNGLGRKGETRYLAIIGDIRRSRQAKERAEVQRRLEAALQKIGRQHAGVLASRFVVTLGDEFQGLLAEPSAVIRILIALESALPGVPLRYGIGWGELSTGLKPTALGMDGRCFHEARAALTNAKKLDRWAVASGFGPEEDGILNGLLALIGAVRAEWTATQAETVALVRDRPTKKEAAAARGVALSTVHKALAGALFVPVVEAEQAAEKLVGLFAKRPGAPSPAPSKARKGSRSA